MAVVRGEARIAELAEQEELRRSGVQPGDAILIGDEVRDLQAAQAVGMAAGAVAIAFSSASADEYTSWKEAAQRESDLYRINPAYVAESMEGKESTSGPSRRTWIDALLVSGATGVFVIFGALAIVPHLEFNGKWLIGLAAAMLIVLVAGMIALGKITRFK